MQLHSAKDLDVYKKGYQLAVAIFLVSKSFPDEERFALTSQIRRSSRSVCLNLREAWSKRRYEAHFVSKLTDCDAENSETDFSLDFAKDCQYITVECQAVNSQAQAWVLEEMAPAAVNERGVPGLAGIQTPHRPIAGPGEHI